MTSEEWKLASQDVLYRAMFVRDLTDGAVVDRGARALIASRLADRSPAFYYDGFGAALASEETLTAAFDTPHTEQGFRDFLRLLRQRMDQLRPWPTPPFVRLPAEAWATFADAKAVATVALRMGDAEQRLLVSAHRLPEDDSVSALMLRLSTGDEVALLGTPGIRPVTLLSRGDGDPAATITAFREATGVPPELITATR
jgi:hypothetical protein